MAPPQPTQAPSQPAVTPPPPPPTGAVTRRTEASATPHPAKAWLSAAAALAVVAAVLAGIYVLVPRARNTSAAAPPAEAQPPPAPAKAVHPLVNTIELTGFRLMEDRNQRVRVRFIAVNHSQAELPETKLHVSLKREREEIMDFLFTLPSLGPHESKEITATTRTRLRAYELPDWQYIRADFDAPPEQQSAR